MAASISTCHPRAAWVAYPLAAAVGWARADAGAHTWLQVLAGAALGTFIGRQAGQGKLRVFGHKDQSPAPTARTAQVEGGNTEYTASLGPSMQLTMWGTSF